ncbi:Fumarate reductase flavoprotein subunit precursor [Variovorax sp. PBS-H4]|uniref:FAD-dependent oxidoreductase n=1 Tax=Variovorax sp. PBS-H4 TaxID=434008 RepID=UPI001317571F|nr:flavocytochrome c [Variovorax sp. PBS-H4]VTU27568.1 Fumarate reductase flavoprotein subunit precursor [Variovorax sp. PBS-H4]
MKTVRTGLLVIGGGAAGFAAALEAATAGVQVTLLEKTADIGGSSAMSGGCLAFAGTDLQEAEGVEDSAELLRSDLIEVGQHDNDPAVVDAYVHNQLDTYRWLRGLGLQFSPSLEASSGQSVPRVHTVDPADMVRLLAARCEATGRVEVWMSTRAERLLRQGEAAPVTGVLADGPEGRFAIESDRGVLLASGGFCRNAELVHRFAPHYAEAVFVGGEGNVGDGLLMAWKLGADLRDMAYIKGTFGKHPTDVHNNHSCLAVYKGAIAVNQDGKRFVDESISYKLLGDAVMRQPYHTSYQIFDEPVFQSGDDRVRILDFGRRMEEGLMVKADTLEALARQIEVPAEVLRETVDRYNAFVDEGHDPEFGRRTLVHRQGELRRIEEAPFYAYPSTAAVFGTYCGLRIDADMRVIDVFGEPIAGLYAAGEVVGGFHGGAYMTGSALGKAVVFGRLAVRTACRAAVAA